MSTPSACCLVWWGGCEENGTNFLYLFTESIFQNLKNNNNNWVPATKQRSYQDHKQPNISKWKHIAWNKVVDSDLTLAGHRISLYKSIIAANSMSSHTGKTQARKEPALEHQCIFQVIQKYLMVSSVRNHQKHNFISFAVCTIIACHQPALYWAEMILS